jgi:hypothetical protein
VGTVGLRALKTRIPPLIPKRDRHAVHVASVSARPRHRYERDQGRAGDEVRVEVISLVREVAALTRSPDGVLRPAEENGSLSDIERSCAVLEHLWNTNVVDRWGSLVIRRLLR